MTLIFTHQSAKGINAGTKPNTGEIKLSNKKRRELNLEWFEKLIVFFQCGYFRQRNITL